LEYQVNTKFNVGEGFYSLPKIPAFGVKDIIKPAIKWKNSVMPDLIRHPVFFWIPAFAGMTG